MAEENGDKKKVGIIIAIIAGLLALGMMFVFLKGIKNSESKRNIVSNLPTKKILVATKDLPVGHVMDVNSDLKPIDIPVVPSVRSFIDRCVPAADVQLFEGRVLANAVAADNPLLYSYMAESFNFDEKFKSGFLKTVILSKENLFGSRLVPGDHVDILVTMPKPQDTEKAIDNTTTISDLTSNPNALVSKLLAPLGSLAQGSGGEMQTITILEDVEVFMVGSLISMDRIQLGYNTQSEVEDGDEITFRLDKSDAVTLTQYYNSRNSTISLLLRPRQ